MQRVSFWHMPTRLSVALAPHLAAPGLEWVQPLQAEILLVDGGIHSPLPQRKDLSSSARIVLLSDAAVYGEGVYHCGDCGPCTEAKRTPENWPHQRWEVFCPICGDMMMPQPMREQDKTNPMSYRARRYRAVEKTWRAWADEHHHSLMTLRLFSVYRLDDQQPLNPLWRLWRQQTLQNKAIYIPEDGYITRDWLSVPDLARILASVMALPTWPVAMLNVGTGEPVSLFHLAVQWLQWFNLPDERLDVSQRSWLNQPRHQVADTRLLQTYCGYASTHTVLSLSVTDSIRQASLLSS